MFIDESKARDYLMVAAVIPSVDTATTRTLLRSLMMAGQPRLHMKKESEPRKKQIAAALVRSGVQAVVYTADQHTGELAARAICLNAVIADAARHGISRLVLERDDSLIRWDSQRLIELTRQHHCRDTLTYQLLTARQELLLCIPDAIAWCWAKGGHWHRRIQPAVTTVRQV